MKASALEFRFRLIWMTLVILLGFSAPWIELFHWGARTTTWLWLGFELGGLGISSAFGIQAASAISILVAAAAAAMRVWGTAYLGIGTVNNMEMQAGPVMADGPFRYVRNPLYIGSWLMVAAISVLMPPTGALVTMVLLTIFLLRLILAEETFLSAQLGERYAAYLRTVPRLIPSLRPRVSASGQRPNWGRALLGEVMPLGVLVSFAVLSWQYNAQLLIRAVLISFGLSLVVRAVIQPKPASPQSVMK